MVEGETEAGEVYGNRSAGSPRDSANDREQNVITAPEIAPHGRRERDRLALLEAEIAQTCYQLSRLRGEHRRIRSRLALVEATMVDSLPACIAVE